MRNSGAGDVVDFVEKTVCFLHCPSVSFLGSC